MKIFISGGAKNGKTSLAQQLAVRLSKDGRRYYLATMIPGDAEDISRIKAHIKDREGLGFETVECGKNIIPAIEDKEGTYLLDSVTALLQNVMFPADKNYEPDLEAAEICKEELLFAADSVKNIIFVSDHIFSDAEEYSELTENYRKALAGTDRCLAKKCDVVIEASGGSYTVHKGKFQI